MNLNEAIAAAYAGKKVGNKSFWMAGYIFVKDGKLCHCFGSTTNSEFCVDHFVGSNAWEIVPPPILLKDLKVGQRFKFSHNTRGSIYKVVRRVLSEERFLLNESTNLLSANENEYTEVELV